MGGPDALSRDNSVAEEENVWMGLHPDDPSFNVRARPRIVKDSAALKRVVGIVPSPSNGITFCPGSLATRRENDVLAIAEEMWPHFVFCHFRNIRFLWDGDQNGETAFLETYHADEKGAVPIPHCWLLHAKGCKPRIARTCARHVWPRPQLWLWAGCTGAGTQLFTGDPGRFGG